MANREAKPETSPATLKLWTTYNLQSHRPDPKRLAVALGKQEKEAKSDEPAHSIPRA